MDLINMINRNRAQIHEFIRSLNRANFYFPNQVTNWQDKSYEKIQNFSSISPKLWTVNTTIVLLIHVRGI